MGIGNFMCVWGFFGFEVLGCRGLFSFDCMFLWGNSTMTTMAQWSFLVVFVVIRGYFAA